MTPAAHPEPDGTAPPAMAAPTADGDEATRLLSVAREPYDRWVLAARIARRLGPAAWERGGFASSELTVAIAGFAPLHPAAAVVVGVEPLEPVVTAPPLLVIELAPRCAPGEWLGRGVGEVWSVGADAVVISRAGRPPRRATLPATLELAPDAVEAGAAAAPLRLRVPLDGDGGGEERIG